jgi:hypothetical protein
MDESTPERVTNYSHLAGRKVKVSRDLDRRRVWACGRAKKDLLVCYNDGCYLRRRCKAWKDVHDEKVWF